MMIDPILQTNPYSKQMGHVAGTPKKNMISSISSFFPQRESDAAMLVAPQTLVEHPKLVAAGLLMAEPRAMTPHLRSFKVLDESCQHQQAPFCALPPLVQKSVPVERWDVLWLHRRVVALFITPGIQTWLAVLAGNSPRIRCVSQSSQTSPSV
jgi:hypothetical protein